MFKFAAIQMCAHHIVDDNLGLASQLIQKACDDGADVIGLPEGFSHYGLNRADKLAHAEEDGQGVVQDFLATMALKYKVWLLGGTVLIKQASGHYYISSLFYNPQGIRVARYNKIHLFRANLTSTLQYSETDIASPGEDYIVVTTPFGRIGLSVCFDLRFPEHFKKLYQLGAEVIAVPSAFTYITGKAHWELLLRCRALDTFCFIVAPAQFGKHSNGLQTFGHTMIINPWGEIKNILRTPQNGIVMENIDIREVYQCRRKILK